MTSPASEAGARARRELRLAVLLCLVGSVLVLFAVSRPWGDVAGAADLTIKQVRDAIPGTKVAAEARALGLVGVAGVLAIAATRRWGRTLVGLALALSGAAIVWRVALLLGQGLRLRLASAHANCSRLCILSEEQTKVRVHHAWPTLTLVGGLLLLVAGGLIAARGRRWAALSSSYDAPSTTPAAPVTDKGVWDALDRGDDPTA